MLTCFQHEQSNTLYLDFNRSCRLNWLSESALYIIAHPMTSTLRVPDIAMRGRLSTNTSDNRLSSTTGSDYSADTTYSSGPPTATVRPIVGGGAKVVQRSSKRKSGMLEESEALKVETFYRSHGTDVRVCRCMANLYFGVMDRQKGKSTSWELQFTGIPAFLLDSGTARRGRALRFVMAERGTGFVLWKDQLDLLSKYRAEGRKFHTFTASTDRSKVVGVSFDDSNAADDFLRHFQDMTADASDNLLKGGALSRGTKRKTVSTTALDTTPKKTKQKKFRFLKKRDISAPCGFTHVTNIRSTDAEHFLTMSLLAPPVVRSARSEPHLPLKSRGRTLTASSQGSREEVKAGLSQSQDMLAQLKL